LKGARWFEPIHRQARNIDQTARVWLSQKRCEAMLRFRGFEPPGESWIFEEVRRILADRGLRPKHAGELHLFLFYRLRNWEQVLPSALAPFGEVTEFEWSAQGFDDREPDWLVRREAMNRSALAAFRAAHARRPVDAVVGYLSGYDTAPETLRAMQAAGAAVFNFCWDDRLGFPGPMRGGRRVSPAAIAAAIDLNLTSAPSSVVKYAAYGGRAVFFPEAAQPSVHRAHDLPFDLDVSFVGARYGWRDWYIAELRTLGVDVVCFGHGWPQGSLTDEEMVKLYSRSRINLGFSHIGYARSVRCLKGRDFEVPMSGGLYLSEHSDDLGLVYEIGKEVVTFNSPQTCAEAIRRLLADPPEAARIRAAGRARALRDHTYEARWGRIFKATGLLQ
jgi:hypothetical protein